MTDLINLIYEYMSEGIKNINLKLPVVNETLYHLSLYIVFALLILRKWWKVVKRSIFLILWFLGPILLTWLVSQKFTPIFYNRYLLYAIPPAMMLIVSARSKLSFIPLSLLIVLFAFIDYDYFTHPAKLPFKQYSQIVKSELRSGDYLINWNSSSHHLWETKFYGIPAPIYIPKTGGTLPFFVGTALMTDADIVNEIPEGTERVGVVTSGPVEEINVPGYTESEVRTSGNLKFVLMVKNNSLKR
jgi:hypothetical protein